MTDITKFKPNTVYVIYIASTPEKVWQALTDPAFTRQYFGGFSIDVEPKVGGAFFCANRTDAFTCPAAWWSGRRRAAFPARG